MSPGVDIDVQVRGERAKEALRTAPQLLREALDLAVRDTADEILAVSQTLVPVDKGTLKKSGNVRYGDLEATVGYNTPYAAFMERGTAPHAIRPRSASVLAFPPSGARSAMRGGRRVGVFQFGGHKKVVGLIFAREVHHPGTRPYRYLAGAVERVLPLVPAFVRRRIGKALDRIRAR